MKTAYIFPGQGSQFPGMGKELYNHSSKAREMMEQADEILGFRITDIMFEGTEEDLRATRVTQPAIFLHSVCAALCSHDTSCDAAGVSSAPSACCCSDSASPASLAIPAPDMVGGHSLGEFSALAVSGAVSFEDALRLVAVRANEMQKCCEKVPGTMAAIIGLSNEAVEEICAATAGTVIPANYNCDGQVVISGDNDAVAMACEALKAAGARRALPLSVGGAFHSPLMEPARLELAKAIEATAVIAPRCPVYQNVTAMPETDPARIKANLLLQLTSPVLWTHSVKNMLSDGAASFIEFGPGNVLQGLVKRIAAAAGAEVTLSSHS